MADFYTHDLFGRTVEQEAPQAVREVAKAYPEAFRWGLQGPDILFFRRLWQDKGPYHKMGNRMHSERTDEMFAAMADCIRRQEGWRRDCLSAYFYGFLCHYALDSEIHPYVYYLQKQGEKRNPDAGPGVLHCQIETDIDVALYTWEESRDIANYHPYDGHHLPFGQNWVIGEMYETVMLEVYGEVLPAEEAAGAFADMLLVEDILYRRGRELGKAAFAAGLVKPQWSDFVSHAKIAPPDWDALNLHNRGWRNPDEPEYLRRDSVLELMDKAEEKALALMADYAAMAQSGDWEPLHYPVAFDNGNARKYSRRS